MKGRLADSCGSLTRPACATQLTGGGCRARRSPARRRHSGLRGAAGGRAGGAPLRLLRHRLRRGGRGAAAVGAPCNRIPVGCHRAQRRFSLPCWLLLLPPPPAVTHDRQKDLANAAALGSALLAFLVVPWCLTLTLYTGAAAGGAACCAAGVRVLAVWAGAHGRARQQR